MQGVEIMKQPSTLNTREGGGKDETRNALQLKLRLFGVAWSAYFNISLLVRRIIGFDNTTSRV